MNGLYTGLGMGLAIGIPLMGVAAIFHGFNFITINHYHNDK